MPKVYFSHPIRGFKGDLATDEDMRLNCDEAVRIVRLLRDYANDCGNEISIYCPAEHEDFVNTAYKNVRLTVDNILAIDCDILKTCNALLVYSPENQVVQGCKVELDFAITNGIPVLIFNDNNIQVARDFCKDLK